MTLNRSQLLPPTCLDARLGILSDRPFDLVVLSKRVTGAVYLRVLVNDFPPTSLETCAFSSTATHVGSSCRFLLTLRQHLNQTFSEQWIGRGGPVNGPVRSPDLNLLEFSLWGHLKTS